MEYTSERNHQILIELLKKHGIRKIVVSPGGTNVTFVASVQNDPFFELYSSVDERSAAYIACGMAEESGEPVVLSCTGATAARNYFSGLTEAYYRKLPILAVTSTMPIERVGHLIPQVTDRSVISNDIAKKSVLLPVVKDFEDEWSCTLKCNEALLELRHRDNGPIHINIETTGGPFNVKKIQPVHMIKRIFSSEIFPSINELNVGIFVGAHSRWSDELTNEVDKFCQKYNAVVICDHTSNYKGNYGVLGSLLTSQTMYTPNCTNIDLLIHIGNISGAYIQLKPKKVWRVSIDGKIIDTFKSLDSVFEMTELEFFKKYNSFNEQYNKCLYYEEWRNQYDNLLKKIPDIPFSNIWVASQLSKCLPQNSVLHLGILNSLRSWNFFEINKSISCYSNTGGFGIDGCISTMLGASLSSKNILHFGIVGDLAFFYDMNVLGNRYYSNNMRLIIINNGKGQEFKNKSSRASSFCESNDMFIAASGHYGKQSKTLVKDYVTNLGIEYMYANSKDTFLKVMNDFTKPLSKESKPIVFEIFTDSRFETEALDILQNLEKSSQENTKQIAKKILGEKGVKTIKGLLKR